VKQLAKDIRAINVPVGFSFAHEFNGYWYPWGLCVKASDLSCKVKPKQYPSDFKKAWKRMHGQFKTAGATNAIWIWQANEIGPRPANKLKYWYPGASYVDWLGIVGYYYASNNRNHTFKTLFTPTINQMKTFAKNKPILIPEVSTEPSKRSAADVRDFLKGVAARRDVIGFMWFDINKPSENKDWRINARQDELKAFKYWIKHLNFGVKVK
jgi:beta-mannanase